MFDWFKRRRRDKILQNSWPDRWSSYLQSNVWQYSLLDESMLDQLQKVTRILVAEKNWEGVDGLTISEEIKVTIAGQSALMLLGVEDYYFDNVKTILVSPAPMRRKTRKGWVIDEDQYNSGEAWQGGPIVLSWSDVINDRAYPEDGQNLVIHEFAHCLDGIDGEMGGDLMFDDKSDAKRWQEVCDREYDELCHALDHGRHTFLNAYAATNKAEFFAVTSETFFEIPKPLRRRHPELFELLVKYYNLDPIMWQRQR